ncbi:unnamed protein product [Camellia sinensis]
MDEDASYREFGTVVVLNWPPMFEFEYWQTINQASLISDLRLACKKGDLQSVERLIRRNRKLCLTENCSGKTDLHIFAVNRKVGVIHLILRYYNEPGVTATIMEACLHVAVKPNQIDVLIHLLKWSLEKGPTYSIGITNGYAQTTDEPANYREKELNGLLIWNYKFANLLLACKMGDLEMVEELIIENRILCFEKDGFGKTALHIAAENGKVDALRVFLPLNSDGSVAIDISYDPSYLNFLGICWEPRLMITWDLIKHTGDYSQRGLSNGSRDLTEEKIKQNDNCRPGGLSNGSRDLTEEKIKHNDNCSPRGLPNIQIIEPNDDYSRRGLLNWSSHRSIVEPSVRFRTGLLLIAALTAATTFVVPFHFLGSTSKEGYEQHSIMRCLIISCNSLVFIASVGVITYLLHEFPLKPLPHSLILALFGCYMLSLNAIMPNGALSLFFISIPILLVGICREALWLCKPKTHLSTSVERPMCFSRGLFHLPFVGYWQENCSAYVYLCLELEPSSWGLNYPGGDVQSVTDQVKSRSLLWR